MIRDALDDNASIAPTANTVSDFHKWDMSFDFTIFTTSITVRILRIIAK